MRLRHMLRKEFQQFRRNPVLLRMAVLMPLMQTLLLSYAANLDVKDVPLAIWDEDRSQHSRELIARIESSGYFVLRPPCRSDRELQDELDRSTALLALHLPPHLGRDLERGTATAQLLVDGTESTTATVAGGYLSQLAGAWSQGLRLQTIDRRGWPNRLPRVESQPRVFYNPDLRSMWYMAPGLLALVLTVLMQNLTALSIARERELGTLEQLVMTPIRPHELLLGKLIPYGVVGLADAAVVTAIVVGFLGVPLRGDLLVLGASTVLFLFATLGLGLVISTVSANQQQAQLANFFLNFPSLLLSGFIFPVRNLPLALKPISYAVPMTYYLEVVRGVFLRASGFSVLWPQMLALFGLGLLFFTIGVKRFHKRLD